LKMDTGESDDVPVVEHYRGCGLHDCQSTERLRVVRAAIDHVYTLDQVLDLVEYAGNVRNPPESRLLALARCRALWELAQEAREPRPIINLAHVEALAAGCGSRAWRSPTHFCSLLDAHDENAAPRDQPLDDLE
jgi:hypothetical protein